MIDGMMIDGYQPKTVDPVTHFIDLCNQVFWNQAIDVFNNYAGSYIGCICSHSP